MDSETEGLLQTIWDVFAEDDFVYRGRDGERHDYDTRKAEREDRLPEIRELISSFRSGERDIVSFRQEMDSESKTHNHWGFLRTGQMFFNMLRNEAQRQGRVGEVSDVLRGVLEVPADPASSVNRIEELTEVVENLKANAKNKQKAPQAGFIPYFLSYFWQISEPDAVPIYYKSMRDMYRKLDIWRPVDSLGDSYRYFWKTTEEVREVFEEHHGEDVHHWQVEFALLNALERWPLKDGGPTDTFGDFEDRSKGVLSSRFAIDEPEIYLPKLDEVLDRVQTALVNGKHILFVGPPGTGKTSLATHVCRSAVGDEFTMTTATADWSTFDTIGGYHPSQEGELSFRPGVFLDCLQDAEGMPRNRWLIIDEINRADIDKAFGSLFTALTGDDVTLPFTDGAGNRIVLLGSEEAQELDIEPYRYYIPEGWRVIATMNTMDKTALYEMSYAFMRRWAFIHVPIPDDIDGALVEQYATLWDGVDVDEELCEEVATLWEVINETRPIGPAIIEDIYRYLSSTPGDHASPLSLYVVPQLEGLRDDELVEFVDRMGDETVVDRDSLEEFVSEFFGIDRERFER